jgi:hypothetical protein
MKKDLQKCSRYKIFCLHKKKNKKLGLPQDEVIFAINFVFHGNDSYRSNDILKAVPVSILD